MLFGGKGGGWDNVCMVEREGGGGNSLAKVSDFCFLRWIIKGKRGRVERERS